MLKKLFSFLTLVGISGSLFASGLQEDIDNATVIVRDFAPSIPQEVFDKAEGVAVLKVVKAGFLVSGRGGDGIVVAKNATGWSAPSALGVGGVGLGLQIGVEVSDLIIVLNTKEAVDLFMRGGDISLGANLSIAAGPDGRSGEGTILPGVSAYTYVRSEGAFFGVSLEGTVIVEGRDANAKFYGKPVTAAELLTGKIPRPDSAKALYAALGESPKVHVLGFFGKLLHSKMTLVLGIICVLLLAWWVYSVYKKR